MKTKPNLFSFATTELSQDAFLCWLLSWGTTEPETQEEEQLYKCAKDFLLFLYQLEHPTFLSGHNTVKIIHIERQYKKIDVYVQALIDEKLVSFIIEDKTHTSFHSNQLNRYREEIEKDVIDEQEIIGIYFKTGYLFDRDRSVIEHQFNILDCDMMHEFLGQYTIKHPIYADYKNYLYENFCLLHTTALHKLEYEDNYSQFQYDFVQYEYMKLIAADLTLDGKPTKLTTGRNMDGSPFTLYRVLSYPIESQNERIFYRLDKRIMKDTSNIKRTEYYLSIRQYSYVKGKPSLKKEKVERLKVLKDCWANICHKDSGLRFSAPIIDLTGRNESEIAVLFFDENVNTPSNVRKLLPVYHHAFMRKIESYLKLH